jgi:hypothetical protein
MIIYILGKRINSNITILLLKDFLTYETVYMFI